MRLDTGQPSLEVDRRAGHYRDTGRPIHECLAMTRGCRTEAGPSHSRQSASLSFIAS
jgi:hypothetical protein